MMLFTRLGNASRLRPVAAAVLGLALLSGAVATATPAHAAGEIVVDQEFAYPGSSFSYLNTHGDRWAQPFTPTQDGALATVTVVVNGAPDSANEFAGMQIHELDSNGVIEANPIAGGVGALTFATHATSASATTATATFAANPDVTKNKHYAIVVDPRVAASGSQAATVAAFPILFIGQDKRDYFVMQERADGWGSANYTGQVYFSVGLRLPVPDVTVTPAAPTLVPSTDCGVPDSLTVPVQEGIEFTRTDIGTTTTVTATALAGYVLASGAVASWTFEISTPVCPVAPITTTPESPRIVGATCEAPGSLHLAETPGIVYQSTGPAEATIVTATALAGYVLAPGSVSEWTFDLRKLACETPTPEQPGTEKTPSTEKPGNQPGTEPGVEKPATQNPVTQKSSPKLAKTGSDVVGFGIAALTLAALGMGVLGLRRRLSRG